MKRLMQISVLLLFMIGLFTVQLDFKPLLVDDDVGMEYIDNLNLFDDDAILTTIVIENPGQIASPLKYLIITSGINNTGNRNQVSWFEVKRNYTSDNANMVNQLTLIAEISSTDLVNRKTEQGCQINAPEYTFIVAGLFRLDIGESFQKT